MNKKETVSIPLNNDPIPGTLRVTANMEKVTDYKLSDKVVTFDIENKVPSKESLELWLNENHEYQDPYERIKELEQEIEMLKDDNLHLNEFIVDKGRELEEYKNKENDE